MDSKSPYVYSKRKTNQPKIPTKISKIGKYCEHNKVQMDTYFLSSCSCANQCQNNAKIETITNNYRSK